MPTPYEVEADLECHQDKKQYHDDELSDHMSIVQNQYEADGKNFPYPPACHVLFCAARLLTQRGVKHGS